MSKNNEFINWNLICLKANSCNVLVIIGSETNKFYKTAFYYENLMNTLRQYFKKKYEPSMPV